MFNEFSQEEGGAQVIEYTLVIATISLALIIGLQLLAACLTTPSSRT
jgi:Flp pilus assembly pilin Flp